MIRVQQANLGTGTSDLTGVARELLNGSAALRLKNRYDVPEDSLNGKGTNSRRGSTLPIMSVFSSYILTYTRLTCSRTSVNVACCKSRGSCTWDKPFPVDIQIWGSNEVSAGRLQIGLE